MKKLKINLFGGGFQHQLCSTMNRESKYISWEYNSKKSDCTFYVDNHIPMGFYDNHSSEIYGWLQESGEVIKEAIEFCKLNYRNLKKKFKNIFTHDSTLLLIDSEFFKFVPCSGSWINDQRVHKKSKLVSMITSDKCFTSGHKKRMDFVNRNKEKIDLFGRGFKEIAKKEEGLNEYMFSICIENTMSDYYFSEKILDCFATGTIPVYMGARKIHDFFDKRGIILIDDNFNIENISLNLYNEMYNSVCKNFELFQGFPLPEDWIYLNYIGKGNKK